MLGDGQRLRQLLLALLDNAVRYSSAGGSVEVRVAADGGRLQVDVLDRGIGIPPEELPLVLERHFRGRAARRHRADGSGLGLPIARALAQAHGGTLALMPREGGGTCARLTLPLAPGVEHA